MKKIIYIVLIAIVGASASLNELNNRPVGDVNQDGLVNILDIVLAVDLILNNNNYDSNADLNNDQVLNVIDIVELVNIIIDVPVIPDNAYGSPETLDILTWNVEHFPKNNNTIDTLASVLSDLYVDIVALQEIESTNSLIDVANQLGDNWVAYRSDSNSSWGELSYLINTDNVDILQAPYTILNQHEYEFAWRAPYLLKISYNGLEYTLINIHYKCCDGSEDRRLESSIYLDQYIQLAKKKKKV